MTSRPAPIGAIDAAKVPTKRFRWPKAYRLVPSRYPPIAIFERVAPREDFEALYRLEELTNPRLRDEAGDINLVPHERRVTGLGASIVMAPFTHCSTSRPRRFSDGRFGVYYAAQRFDTALCEVAFHMARFHAATRDPALRVSYRTYAGKVDRVFHDVRGPQFVSLLGSDPVSYAAPQALAAALRSAGSNGIVYPSVRHVGGQCLAAFWPDVVGIPVQGAHIELKWNGNAISEWFGHGDGAWHAMPT